MEGRVNAADAVPHRRRFGGVQLANKVVDAGVEQGDLLEVTDEIWILTCLFVVAGERAKTSQDFRIHAVSPAGMGDAGKTPAPVLPASRLPLQWPSGAE